MTTFEDITRCNKFFSQETLHPLVSLIDLADAACDDLLQLDFYSVLFKEFSRCSCCGQKEWDFSGGTAAFIPPGHPVNMEIWTEHRKQNGKLLCFHPSLIAGSPLEEHFGDYTFFRYRQNEALHVSERERDVIKRCMDSISEELHYGVDEYSRILLINKIELLLNICARYYRRQFITRHEADMEMVDETDRLLQEYFMNGQVSRKGLPGAEYLSRMLGLSPAYFDDMLKHETGKRTGEYVLFRRLAFARELLRCTDKTVTEISKELGFPSPQYFSSLFRKLTGCSPQRYRVPQIVPIRRT